MNANTKYVLKNYNIKEIVLPHTGEIKSIIPLKDGEFNAAYKLVGERGNYLLKAAPPPDADVLQYERGLMKNEYNLLSTIKKYSRVRVPAIIHKDFSRRELDTDYMILEFFDNAKPLNKIKLSKVEYGNLMFELGQEVAKLHMTKTGAVFGYSHQKLHANWRDAFTVMFNQVVDDCNKRNIKIYQGKQAADYVTKNLRELEAVKEPVLTHFDIWPGNIFVDTKTKRFRGLIDAERGYYGDPAGDFISLNPFSPIEQNDKFLDGYRNIRRFEIDENIRIRMNMLRLYLGVIMTAEAPVRWGRGLYTKIRQYIGKSIIKKVLNNKY